MVVSALVAICLGQGTLFKQVIPNPTGKNGYEELVRAAEILRDRQFSAYFGVDVQGVVPESRQQEGSKGELPVETPPEVQAVYNALKGKTLLERRRWALERYAPAIELLYKAAEKPIFDPRTDLNMATLFSELAGFKDIAKFIQVASYVYLADGKNQQAVQLMVTGLDVFERASYGTLIQYLVGIACHSIVFASVEQNLMYFNQADAKRLESGALALLERKPGVYDAIVNDAKFTSSALHDVLKKPDEIEKFFGEDDLVPAKTALQKLDETGKLRLLNAVQQRLIEHVKQVSQKFLGDESGWVQKEDSAEDPKRDWSTEQGMTDSLIDLLMPAYDQVGIAAARSRTQVRILGLVASIIKFRWEHNQLPVKLEDAVGKERALDPLSHLPFELRKDGMSGFSVVSKGTKETGEIALRYRRQTTGGNPGPP